VDPVEFSLFASRIGAVCEEMGAALARAAFSPNIRDRLDFSCAVFDAAGRLCAQAAHIPVHLGSMAYAMRDLVRGREWGPGDALVLNDPYLGGTHLPDVTVVMPVFAGGRLVAFVADRAHHADIGAESPGSMPLSRTLEEEGIVIAPTWIARGGEVLEEVLADRQLDAYAERLARTALAAIPEGDYAFTDVLDDDGLGHEDLPIRVTVRARGGEVTVDFAGTAPQVPGNVNCPLPVTAAAVYYVFRCLMPEGTPAAWGAFRPIRILAPEGSLVHARRPAAVAAGNVETSTRIVDALCGALAQALPEAIPAASHGSMNNVAMGWAGPGPVWDYYETIGGGMGAGPRGGGLSGVQTHMTNTRNTPVEALEMRFPVRVRRYALRRGSGGRGRRRGGDGLVREFEFLAPARVTLLTERRRHAPWGLAGGGAGAPGENRLNGRPLPGKVSLEVGPGDRLAIATPGGGGWGRPQPPAPSSQPPA